MRNVGWRAGAGDDSSSVAAGLVERAATLPPFVAELAPQSDSERRVPEESLRAVTDAGLLRVLTPRRYGGDQTDIVTHAAVTAALARQDGSLAWVIGLSNVFSWVVAQFPVAAQDEVWGAGPDVRVCCSNVSPPTARLRRVDGGAIVSGEWGWASGSLHADWAICSVPLGADGERVDGMALVPMSDGRVEDTWQVAGMRGTGSNTIVLEDVFVPDHRLMSNAALSAREATAPDPDAWLYCVPFVPMMRFGLSAPIVGIAAGALDFVVAKAARRAISHTEYARQDASAAFQSAVGAAAGMVNTVELHTQRIAQDLDRAGYGGGGIDLLDRARMRSDLGRVSGEARRALELLATAHGSSGFASASPMQRFWRDIGTATRHAHLASMVADEIYGKALLGVDQPPALV